jgi:hypothetical protein
MLPPPRPALWPLRPVASADVTDELLPDGRRRITVRHAELPGVTPEMLDWWYGHVDGPVEVEHRDADAAIIAKRVAGGAVLRLVNEFSATRRGTAYRSRMELGTASIAGRLGLNRLVRRQILAAPRPGHGPGTTSRRSATWCTSCRTCGPARPASRPTAAAAEDRLGG